MNKYQTMDEFYKACGDAIRTKKNNTEQVEKKNIPEEILSIPTNEALVVVTPNLSSIRDADKVISILKTYQLSQIKCVVNRMRGDLVLSGEIYADVDIENTLKVPIVGVIPEDDSTIDGIVDNASKPSFKAFKLLANNVKNQEEKTFDYIKKYTGFWGSIRRELKKRL